MQILQDVEINMDGGEELCVLMLGMILITFSAITIHEYLHAWQHPNNQVDHIVYLGIDNDVNTIAWMTFEEYVTEDDCNEEALPTFVMLGYMITMIFWLLVGLFYGEEH